ncbi:DUF1360 domain-containing protein [Streptomyces sp. RS10V-4]|uniref:DUF1360 domain-containing protein n=1 Tax=Streptomyces rhizoryzae TaxID=2932493 RepID=UPI002003BB03|nr:DUF1360 domain-containing protein [Streptomyces rhizoryzae]MCK7624382.1 DUF1360 domain-containing protein [Streptomyces rhizoryzae]
MTGPAPDRPEHTGPFAAYTAGSEAEIPLRGYATLAACYVASLGLFAAGVRAARRPLPDRLPPWELFLLGTAAYKASRTVAKDKITSFLRAPFTRRKEAISASEVMDEPRGHGLRLAAGELLACPFCLAPWVGGVLFCGSVVAPRATRLVAGGLTAVTFADWLQYAWSLTQQQAEK